MIGAIAGDIIGSRFEHGQARRYDFKLFHRSCRFTDDTVCALAVARCVMEQGDFAEHIRELARTYPWAGYGGMFRKWLKADNAPAYNSWGNGAPMRVSSIGWLANSLEEVEELAETQSSVTHNHPDAIQASKAIATAIFSFSRGESKSAVASRMENDFGYDLSPAAINGRRWFDISAKGLSQTALSIALSSSDWEDTIRNCALRGGDTDTLACIAGSVAEAMYGVPEEIVVKTKSLLDPKLFAIFQQFEEAMESKGKIQDPREDDPLLEVSGKAEVGYKLLLHSRTKIALESYANKLRAEGIKTAGKYMSDRLLGGDVATVDAAQVLKYLVNTKKPQLFAESAVSGDGSDWTMEELALLGGIGIATHVTVFDDGTHRKPKIHLKPFEATLLFIAGALLRNGKGKTPADWDRVVNNGKIDDAKLADLYEERLLPALKYANDHAAKQGGRAFITMPGVGCGQFAGKFRGRLGKHLQLAITDLLSQHHQELSNLAVLYFDPYKECSDDTQMIGSISFRTRPLFKTAKPKPQLLQPVDYEEAGDDFSDCLLFSVVAWDHVSWPGNDFYVGSRTTDDGVKAAATSAITSMTGNPGHYDNKSNCFVPDGSYRNWEAVVLKNDIQIATAVNVHVYG